MVGCTICGEVIIVLSDMSDSDIEHYVCPKCCEEGEDEE